MTQDEPMIVSLGIFKERLAKRNSSSIALEAAGSHLATNRGMFI